MSPIVTFLESPDCVSGNVTPTEKIFRTSVQTCYMTLKKAYQVIGKIAGYQCFSYTIIDKYLTNTAYPLTSLGKPNVAEKDWSEPALAEVIVRGLPQPNSTSVGRDNLSVIKKTYFHVLGRESGRELGRASLTPLSIPRGRAKLSKMNNKHKEKIELPVQRPKTSVSVCKMEKSLPQTHMSKTLG